MNIAFVITNKLEFNITHYNNQEIGRAKAMVNKGCNVTIFVYSKFNKEDQIVYKTDKNTLRLKRYKGVPFLGNQTIFTNLKQVLSKEDYDFINIHEYPWIVPVQVAYWYRKSSTKIILVQGMYKDFDGVLKKAYNLMFDILFTSFFKKNVDGVTSKTEAAKYYIDTKFGTNLNSKIIPVGLDIDAFCQPLDLEEEVKEKIESFEKRLLYIGTLEERRNPFFMIKVFAKVVKENPNLGLVVVGKGPLKSSLKEFIIEKQLSSNVVMIDSLSQGQLPWLYKNCDLFLLPSSYEIFGMVLLEALYFNLSVVSSVTAGANEILKGVRNSAILEMQEPEWVDWIINFLNHKSNDTQDGIEHFNKRFSWSIIADEYLRYYEDILSKESQIY